MKQFERCSECSGTGYISFRCTDCICQQCNGKGKVECTNCQNGYLQCKNCNGTGWKTEINIFNKIEPCNVCNAKSTQRLAIANMSLLMKIVIFFITFSIMAGMAHSIYFGLAIGVIVPWFISRKRVLREYEKINKEVNSAGKVTCSICNGTMKKDCEKCHGIGHLPNCAICSGSGNGRKKCLVCGGSGKIENRAFKTLVSSLNNLPTDRLRYESEKRQQEIQQLEIKISRLSSEQRALEAEWQNDYDNHPEWFIHGGWSPSTSGLDRQMGEMNQRIEELKEEIGIVEKILDSKWR